MESLLRKMFVVLTTDFPETILTYENALNIILVQFGARPAYLTSGDVSRYLNIIASYPDLFPALRHQERLTQEGLSRPTPNHIFYNKYLRTTSQVQNSASNLDMGIVLGYPSAGENGDFAIDFQAIGDFLPKPVLLYGYMMYSVDERRRLEIAGERGRLAAILGYLNLDVRVVQNIYFKHERFKSALQNRDLVNLSNRKDSIYLELSRRGFHQTAEHFKHAVEGNYLEEALDDYQDIWIDIATMLIAHHRRRTPLPVDPEAYETQIYAL